MLNCMVELRPAQFLWNELFRAADLSYLKMSYCHARGRKNRFLAGPLFKTALTKQDKKQAGLEIIYFLGDRDYRDTHLPFGRVLEPELLYCVAVYKIAAWI